MNPWVIVAALVAIIGSTVGGEIHGRMVERNYWKARIENARADAAEKAVKAERQTQREVNDALRKENEELASVNATLNGDLERLRSRPRRRVSETSRAECQGTTGAELSREDAGLLAREAARADRLRAALKTCYSYADSVGSMFDKGGG